MSEELDWKAEDFEDRLFDTLADADGRVQIKKFKKILHETGLRDSDPRLRQCVNNFKKVQATSENNEHGGTVDRKTFKECISDNIMLISRAVKNSFIIPDFNDFKDIIHKLYLDCKSKTGGQVASYIPQLARYSPELWAVSICTIDGQSFFSRATEQILLKLGRDERHKDLWQLVGEMYCFSKPQYTCFKTVDMFLRYSIGDVNVPFCLQSTSKPLTYALAQNEYDPDYVHKYVGHEPSGRSFNEISLNIHNKPHNPMINSGAIMMASLVRPDLKMADRYDYICNYIKRLTGGEYVAFNNAVYLSEKDTADRNFALGYYMRENNCFPPGTKFQEIMEFYFQLCSIEVTSDSAAVIAATLANGGYCPITDEKILSATSVRNTLSLMHSCGMYDWSGEFAFTVGLPGKSGVSGCVLLVVPNVMGICVWSPPLDKFGNSVRGVHFCQSLVSNFNFHQFDKVTYDSKKVDPTKSKLENRAMDVFNVLFGAFSGDVTAVRRYYLLGIDMDMQDYDGRTALHLAASEGHFDVVKFLTEKCNCDPFAKDRWSNLPVNDAEKFGHEQIAALLKKYMKTYIKQEIKGKERRASLRID